MATQTFLSERLSKIGQGAAERLDRMSSMVPQPKQPREGLMPFEEYLPRAQAYAAQNPDFAQQLEAAMQQYRAAKGGGNG
jgi:hypothetical protein